MPKILLRSAIVLVLGPFVSTANAKVAIPHAQMLYS
jgi:hypothetical protein